ncbi:MAG: hypothetical protein WD904_03780 [Dehalococcoidia bacterium]
MTALLKERGFAAGYGLMLLGVFVLLDGFAVDAWLHGRDETLAAREGLFTLSNPGHLLIFIGLAVTILGACIGPYSRWVLGKRSVALSLLVPVAAIVIAGSSSAAFATAVNNMSHEDEGHVHDASAAVSDAHTDTATHGGGLSAALHHGHMAHVLRDNQATVALAESTMHEPANNQTVTAENLAFAEQFLVDARAGTEKYQNVAVAEAEGYLRITPDLPLIGAHFFKDGLEGLDPAHPSILLYQDDGADGWKLAGMSYTLPKTFGDDVPPETGLGGLAGWHYHSNLCFLAGGGVTIAFNEGDCGGVFVQETGWLLHVWAWLDSPEGVFNHANSLLQ